MPFSGLFYRAVFLLFNRIHSRLFVLILLQVKSREDLTAEGETIRTEYCSYEEAKMWGIQKMLALRYAVELEQEKFRFVKSNLTKLLHFRGNIKWI